MADPVLNPVYRSVDFTVAHSTTAAAPASQTVSFGTVMVLQVELLIPPGHNGLTGFALRYAGERLLPKAATEFIVGDNLDRFYDFRFPVSAPLTLVGYNTDATYGHTFHLTFKLDLTAATEVTGSTMILPV